MVNVLVTGGAGYVGSHACKQLKKLGFNPITLDNISTGWREFVRFGPLFEGDLLDPVVVESAFERYAPVAVMHFAALSLVDEAMHDPGKYWRVNVNGALNLIEAAVRAGCFNFVFSSTCATYGDHDGVLLDERTIQKPINAYGASKRAIEDILQHVAASHGLRHVIFRYFNVAGADPAAEIGEWHEPETHLIPLVLDAALGRRPHISIYGTDYPTADGTCIRDYVHVCDLVEAHVLGLKWLMEGGRSQVFNLGTGRGFSVRDVIRTARDVTGVDFKVLKADRRPGDAASLVSASSRAREILGWVPTRSSLAPMIEDAWRWHQNAVAGRAMPQPAAHTKSV